MMNKEIKSLNQNRFMMVLSINSINPEERPEHQRNHPEGGNQNNPEDPGKRREGEENEENDTDRDQDPSRRQEMPIEDPMQNPEIENPNHPTQDIGNPSTSDTLYDKDQEQDQNRDLNTDEDDDETVTN